MLLLLLGGWVSLIYAQKEDYVWFFGDSLFLDFNTEPPTVLPTARLWTWKTGTSICDSAGALMFYMNHDSIFDANHELVENGFDFGGSRNDEQGTWILPAPGFSGKYYIFAIGVDCIGSKPCFTYSILENSPHPKLTIKNEKLANQIANKVAVTHHANGQDWWILIHKPGTKFLKYLLSREGIGTHIEQDIGSVITGADNSNIGEMTFSPQGDKLALVGLSGLVEIFDFDRCTGELKNANRIATGGGGFSRFYYSCEFSPNGEVLYIVQATSIQGTTFPGRLIQLDLKADPIWWSRDTVWTASEVTDEPNILQLGPNGKIYLSHNNYPNQALYNSVSQNLTVIHSPDSLGVACNVAPHSLSLAPYKSTFSLPNYPNFRLGPITPKPANAGADQHTCPGVPVPIGTEDTTGTLTYSWWPQDGLDDPYSSTPNAAPQQTTTYYLTVSDPSLTASCHYTEDSVTVIVDWCHNPETGSLSPDLTKPIIPTIVTPDGDGQDDLFSIRWMPDGTKVVIFDNYGRRVFESADYQNDWPGTTAAGGMYFFRVQFPGEALRVGKVMVLP